MDTNGTLALTDRHIDALRRANAAVRISIDALSPEIVRYLRPCRSRDYDCIAIIEANMHLLLAEHISFGVHSVVTRLNLNELESVGDWLQNLGVPRWHLYSLLPNGRARDCFSELRVDSGEMDILKQNLQNRYPEMLITLSPQYSKPRDTPTLMVDSEGRFFVEPVRGIPKYIGKDPMQPTAAEIAECLNVESYVRGYFGSSVKEP